MHCFIQFGFTNIMRPIFCFNDDDDSSMISLTVMANANATWPFPWEFHGLGQSYTFGDAKKLGTKWVYNLCIYAQGTHIYAIVTFGTSTVNYCSLLAGPRLHSRWTYHDFYAFQSWKSNHATCHGARFTSLPGTFVVQHSQGLCCAKGSSIWGDVSTFFCFSAVGDQCFPLSTLR